MHAATNVNFQPIRRRKLDLDLSRHAQVRKQQRAISQDAIELIVFFGERSYDGRGGIRCVMTTKVIARLASQLGASARVEKLNGCYVVLSAEDECSVITVGHLYV